MTAIADAVRRGLTAQPKWLSPFLLYDEQGSRLYDHITALPEYYLTRTELGILRDRAPEIVQAATKGNGASGALSVIELGAGTASKTEVLLREVVRRQARCRYIPIDISGPTLMLAQRRLREVLPQVDVEPRVTTHDEAFASQWDLPSPRLVLFIGSSVANFEDAEAAALLRNIVRSLGDGTVLLLGTDLRKDPEVLLRAYDDAAGVTAAFNRNVLVRLRRELAADFVPERFRHVARWNDGASRIEMHLESLVAQDVSIGALDLDIHFEAGETIHTESSIKYDIPRIHHLLEAGNFSLEQTFFDGDARRFAVHLARAHTSST